MFRHRGKTRTLSHNLQIASLLSFVAGLVNVGGFLAFQRLTTNVTGHFAFFIDELLNLNIRQGIAYALYILFFFFGSFTSGMLIELMSRKNERLIFVIPVVLESIILLSIGILYPLVVADSTDTVTFSLLFAMGLQNSLVTSISNSVVRTTHVTGLFTDLGIELSQMFFYKSPQHKQRLLSSMKLRLTIISFFFLGGITGGVLFSRIGLHIMMLASLLLIAGLIYDNIKFQIILMRRKLRTGGRG